MSAIWLVRQANHFGGKERAEGKGTYARRICHRPLRRTCSLDSRRSLGGRSVNREEIGGRKGRFTVFTVECLGVDRCVAVMDSASIYRINVSA
jgi:hypothetical protein